jgi:hypothetical protein
LDSISYHIKKVKPKTNMLKFYHVILFLLFLFPVENLAQKVSNQLDQYMALVRGEYAGENALETTAYVSEHWRVAGNAGFDSSIVYVQRILASAGYQLESENTDAKLTYRIERYPMRTPAWEPVDAQLYLSDADKPLLNFGDNRNMICINSFSTPITGTTAEVVYLKSCDEAAFEGLDLEGKIVFADCRPYSLFKQAVEKKGAIGILSYSVPYYNQPEKYQNSIPFSRIPFNSKKKAWAINLSYAARTAIHAELEKGPLKVRVQIDTKIYPAEELTLIAEVRGSKVAEERFVYSAHVQEPGANDNASGVGAQAEMARVAAALVQRGSIAPDRTLTFLWGDEIRSTRRYIEQDSLRATGIRWGMSLDMVGEDTEKTGGTFLIEKMPDPSAIWTRGDDYPTVVGRASLATTKLKLHCTSGDG